MYNPFFEKYNTPHDTAPFDKIKLEHFEPAFMEGIRRDNEELDNIINNTDEPTFENTIAIDYDEEKERYFSLLDNVSTVFFNLLSAETNDDLDELAEKIQPILTKHENDVSLNPKLFERIKYVYEHHRPLSEEEEMLLNNTYDGFVRSGALLDKKGKEKLRKLTEEASLLSLQFSQNLLKENKAFTLHLTDENDLAGLPESQIQAAREAAKERNLEGWVITLDNPSYGPFMQYAQKRELREKLYMARNTECTHDNESNNIEICKRLVNLRREVAQLLGYETYADYVLKKRMATNVQNVYNLLYDLIDAYKPTAIKYLDDEDKYEAVVKDVVQEVGKGRPVLIGTVSVENSEKLSRFLDAKGIKHEVLNAKNHAREAEIIAQAGAPKSVTIATNMAGRGTDIVLGGNWQQQVKHLENPTEEQIAEIKKEWQKRHDEVVKAGGLHIIGTERHESRRIDNQLRGRSGRQGDPGSSRFYISFDDSLMKRFIDTEKMKRIFKRIGMQKGDVIENRMVTRSIENAQRKVEARNFDIRKNLIEFDDVANAQRKVIYQQRNSLLDGDDESQVIHDIMYDVINDYVSQFIPPQSLEETWKLPELEEGLRRNFSLDAPVREWLKADDKMFEETLREKIVDLARANFKQKCDLIGKESTIALQKTVMLQCLDQLWKEHLAGMDYLRQGINLRGYAQRNPKFEYKQESFRMFENMLNLYKQRVVQIFCNIQIRSPEEVQQAEEERQRNAQALERKQQENAAGEGAPAPDDAEGEPQGSAEPQQKQSVTVRRAYPKVGRNDPCPCGSGKKYKDCHGRLH